MILMVTNLGRFFPLLARISKVATALRSLPPPSIYFYIFHRDCRL